MKIEIISAITALVAVVVGPIISIYIMRKQNEANIEIAKKNVMASTVSISRQKWIDTLRDCIAELQSAIFPILVQAAGQHYSKEEKKERIDRATFLISKIALLINPKEADHIQLMEHINALLSSAREGESSYEKYKIANKNITDISQSILNREWNVIKQAV